MRFGVKASVKDFECILDRCDEWEFVETFISPEETKNIMKTAEKFDVLSKKFDKEIIVHAPEYFIYDEKIELVDITTEDYRRRTKSQIFMGKVIELAARIGASYIIIHPGSITSSSKNVDVRSAIERLCSFIDGTNYELSVENMPWFYWMINDERYESSLCTSIEHYYEVIKAGAKMTLDTCHAYLCIKEGTMNFLNRAITEFKDDINHVHISDALPPDVEGLQIGNGKIDFKSIASKLNELKANAIFEIRGGHKNCGEEFLTSKKIWQNL